MARDLSELARPLRPAKNIQRTSCSPILPISGALPWRPPILIKLSNVLTQLQRVLYTDLIHGDPSKMQREHLQLVECIRHKDGKGGKKLIIEQLTATQKRIFNERIDFRR